VLVEVGINSSLSFPRRYAASCGSCETSMSSTRRGQDMDG
jgi:hypothetical protein